MDNLAQFFKELEDFYGKQAKGSYVKRMEKLFEDVPNSKLDAVFNEATMLHEASTTMPTVKVMQTAIYNTQETSDYRVYSQKKITETSNMTVEQVIDKIIVIREKEENSTADIDFLHDWDELFYCYTFLKENKGWDDSKCYSYLRPIREKVLRCESIIMSNNIGQYNSEVDNRINNVFETKR